MQFQVQPLLRLAFCFNARVRALTTPNPTGAPHPAQDRLDCVLVLTASEVRCYHFKGVEDPAALSRTDLLISIPLAEDAVYGDFDIVLDHCHFSRISQPYMPQHAPRDILGAVPILIGLIDAFCNLKIHNPNEGLLDDVIFSSRSITYFSTFNI